LLWNATGSVGSTSVPVWKLMTSSHAVIAVSC
jgi:hypothetical protein